jgi:hypothetical protein
MPHFVLESSPVANAIIIGCQTSLYSPMLLQGVPPWTWRVDVRGLLGNKVLVERGATRSLLSGGQGWAYPAPLGRAGVGGESTSLGREPQGAKLRRGRI